MDKRFVIFDMDGTLVDSMGLWHNLALEYLQKRGFSEIPEALLSQMQAMTVGEASLLLVKQFGLDQSPETVTRGMIELMEAHYREDVPLKPGVAAHLDTLRQAGVKMCVASATPLPLIDTCLRRLGIEAYFGFMLSCHSMGTTKHRPDIYLEAARRMGAEPGEVAVYEDALYAIKTAKAAGFYVVGVYDADAALHHQEFCRLTDERIAFPEDHAAR